MLRKSGQLFTRPESGKNIRHAFCQSFGAKLLTISLSASLVVNMGEESAIFTVFYTDKKEKKIFLIDKEIQNEAVAKSYMANGLLNPHILYV